MSITFVDRVKMTTGTLGTGTITLGVASPGYQSFSQAGLSDGATVRYVIEDGVQWEIGTGTYHSAVGTMDRSLTSSSTGSLLSLDGQATVSLTYVATDITNGNGISTLSNTVTFGAGQVRHLRRVTSGPVTLTSSDDTVVIALAAPAATTINLPGSPATGQEHTIKDGNGNCNAQYPWTLTPAAGNIDGGATRTIDQAFRALVVRYDGTQWVVVARYGPKCNVLLFTTSGTYYPSADAVAVRVIGCGGGGGGGGGALTASGTAASGGGGGGAGCLFEHIYRVSDLPSSIPITIGAGGSPGAAASTNGTGGGNGGNGGATSFGSLLSAGGGGYGGGGNVNAGAPGGAGGSVNSSTGSNPGSPVAGVNGSNGVGNSTSNPILGAGGAGCAVGSAGNSGGSALRTAAGGGSGGGVTTGPASNAGGAGGTYNVSPNNGAAGTSGAPNGGSAVADAPAVPGSGGGGGYGNASGAAGAGGNGVNGSGGGGGGSAINGSTAGAGGTGGNGWALIVEFF